MQRRQLESLFQFLLNVRRNNGWLGKGYAAMYYAVAYNLNFCCILYHTKLLVS